MAFENHEQITGERSGGTQQLYVFSVVGTSRCDVRAACSSATLSNASGALLFVPPATTRAGTAQRAIPTLGLNPYKQLLLGLARVAAWRVIFSTGLPGEVSPQNHNASPERRQRQPDVFHLARHDRGALRAEDSPHADR